MRFEVAMRVIEFKNGAKDERMRFVAVLEIPPVDSAQKAVPVQIVKDIKTSKK
jgi:hypothetical protein